MLAARTAQTPDVAMELLNVETTGPAMQPVDVLRHQREVADDLLELHQSLMASVGQTTRQPLTPPVVPLPAQLGIPREGPRGSELFRPILSPQTIGSTEGGYPALPGDYSSRAD